MNCHQNIAEYNGEEDLEKATQKNFIQTKKNFTLWLLDGMKKNFIGETEPVKWVRIHNLPVRLHNHSQHVM